MDAPDPRRDQPGGDAPVDRRPSQRSRHRPLCSTKEVAAAIAATASIGPAAASGPYVSPAPPATLPISMRRPEATSRTTGRRCSPEFISSPAPLPSSSVVSLEKITRTPWCANDRCSAGSVSRSFAVARTAAREPASTSDGRTPSLFSGSMRKSHEPLPASMISAPVQGPRSADGEGTTVLLTAHLALPSAHRCSACRSRQSPT